MKEEMKDIGALTPRVSPQSELLLALAARCEAEAPSRLLDADIAEVTMCRSDQNFADKTVRQVGLLLLHDVDDHLNWYAAPSYTTSLDAAVTLEPKDAQEIVARIYPAGIYVRITIKSGKVVYCEGFANPDLTEPMARCAAALRARAALVEQSREPMQSGEANPPPQGSAP